MGDLINGEVSDDCVRPRELYCGAMAGETDSNVSDTPFGIEEQSMRSIGEGKFGYTVVCDAAGSSNERLVLKYVADKNLAGTDDEVHIHEKISEYVKKFEHPNIVRYIEFLLIKHKFALKMEHVPRGSLYNLMEKVELPWSLADFILRDVAAGMEYLTSKDNVCHGNLHLQNILLTDSFTAKVSDYGLKSVYSLTRQYSNRTGTYENLRFKAPEMVRDVSEQPSKYSDVYSYGAVVYAVLKGTSKPLDELTDEKLKAKVNEGVAVIKLENLRQDHPPVLYDICEKSVKLNPEERVAFPEIYSLLEKFCEIHVGPDQFLRDCDRIKEQLECANAQQTTDNNGNRNPSPVPEDVEHAQASSLATSKPTAKAQPHLKPSVQCSSERTPNLSPSTASGSMSTVQEESNLPSGQATAVVSESIGEESATGGSMNHASEEYNSSGSVRYPSSRIATASGQPVEAESIPGIEDGDTCLKQFSVSDYTQKGKVKFTEQRPPSIPAKGSLPILMSCPASNSGVHSNPMGQGVLHPNPSDQELMQRFRAALDLGGEGNQPVVVNISGTPNVVIGSHNIIPTSRSALKKSKGQDHSQDPEWKARLDSKRAVESDDLDLVADLLGKKWRDLGRKLHFEEGHLDQFDHDHHLSGLKEICYQLLLAWKQREGNKATIGKMAKSLLKVKKGGIVEKLKP